jgi:hypothetical protein
MTTQVFKLNLAAVQDIALEITRTCDNLARQNFHLVGLFTWTHFLIMVFQSGAPST